MDPLVTAALVGTAQRGLPPPDGAAPVDALAWALSPSETERALLLRAACAAVYAEAGVLPDTLPDVPEPAPDERLRPCSPAAATLLWKLFENSGENRDALLLEAFERMRQAGLHLPHDLLPTALYLRPPNLRAAVAPLVGERGRWLSRLNPDWSWLAEELGGRAGAEAVSDETLWQEGTTSQRTAVLRRLRASDPATARALLAVAWKRERAEVRSELLAALEVGLALDDEPFLEAALDDRNAAVRTLAASLLAQLPGSAFAARMRVRADELLALANGRLEVRLPVTLDTDAQRDGIVAKQPTEGLRALWLAHILAHVPLSHWQERFQASPERILGEFDGGEWQLAVLNGFTRSAVMFATSEWVVPLWACWRKWSPKDMANLTGNLPAWLTSAVSQHVTGAYQRTFEAYARTLMADKTGAPSTSWQDFVAALSAPWSDDFGAFYVSALHDFLVGFAEGQPSFSSWSATIAHAALALPPACFPAALVPFEPIQEKSWQAQQFNKQLDSFTDTIRLRQHIQEVFAL